MVRPSKSMEFKMDMVQETFEGVKRLTHRNTFLTEREFIKIKKKFPNVINSITAPCIIKPQKLWSGKQLISAIIPQGISFIDSAYDAQKKSNIEVDNKFDGWIPSDDNRLIVRNGQLLCGFFYEEALAMSQDSLIGTIVTENGPKAAKMFFFYLSLIIREWLGSTDDIGRIRHFPQNVERINLGDVVTKSAIIRDPDVFRSVIPEDAMWQAIRYRRYFDQLPPMSPWVLRMELNVEKLEEIDTDANEVFEEIQSAFGNDLYVEKNPQCDGKFVIRVRIIDRRSNNDGMIPENGGEGKSSELFMMVIEANLMHGLCIKEIRKS